MIEPSELLSPPTAPIGVQSSWRDDLPSVTSDLEYRRCCANSWQAHWHDHTLEFCDDDGGESTGASSRLSCFSYPYRIS